MPTFYLTHESKSVSWHLGGLDIFAVIFDIAYSLELSPYIWIYLVFYVLQVKEFHTKLRYFLNQHQPPLLSVVIDDQQEYEVNNILEHHYFCCSNGHLQLQYKALWNTYFIYDAM